MVKISVDNQVVRLFSQDAEKILESPLGAVEDGLLNLDWPSLFEYLELGRVFSQLTFFDPSQILFTATISALCEVNNPEDLFYIYDSLFTKIIEQVKSLPEVDANFLLQKLEEKKTKLSFWEMEKILSPALAIQERALRESKIEAMHDLVLYLSWDRMCVYMARIFDHPSNHPLFLDNLKKLKWCLIESYQHIASQGRTSPSFYRLIEALFYYQMREEHLHLHPEADWELLTQSFPILKNQNELIDIFYIDHAIAPASNVEEGSFCHLTIDPPELVQSRLALAHYMIEKLKEEIPQWNYALRPMNIIHLSI